MQAIIRRAMEDYDALVIEMEYCDSRGNRTRRIVSPIRFLGPGRFLALCLCSEEPRQFHLSRCSNVRLRGAHHFVMPVPVETLAVA